MPKPRTPEVPRPTTAAWKEHLHTIIFEADTFWGLAFDVVLIGAILLSVLTVSLETVEYFQQSPWDRVLWTIEWVLTALFTIEYILRLLCVRKPLNYAFSFFGIMDLLACLPMYLVLLGLPHSLMIVRSVRLLRIFRVLKMIRMLKEAQSLKDAFWNSREKIMVFVAVVMVAVTISGTLMYQIEHGSDPENSQFTSIPVGMYWAIVTMTTVGYGDVTAVTIPGKFISAVLILLGYSMIIVPTGFVSAELSKKANERDLTSRACPHCLREGHSVDAAFCDMCGERLNEATAVEENSSGI